MRRPLVTYRLSPSKVGNPVGLVKPSGVGGLGLVKPLALIPYAEMGFLRPIKPFDDEPKCALEHI